MTPHTPDVSVDAATLVDAPDDEVFVLPTSFAQQRLWFLDQFEPGSPFYNIPLAVRLEGALDVAALERTLAAIIERHEVLRTTFATLGGRPVQVITPVGAVPFNLPLSDLTHLPDVQREAALLRRADEESRQPFNLSRGPLFRASLLCLGPQEHVVLLTMHHIISDGWSMGVLMREIGAIYSAFSRGRPLPLPELPIQYADFASWQREHLAGDGLERQIAYWRQQLGSQGGPPPLELPTEYPRPAIFSSRGSSVVRQLPRDLVEQLRALSQREGATLFMTLLAGFQALLYRYSGQDDVCVGSPIANRTRAELEPLIGLFINTLVLRARLSPGQSFRSLLAQVRETTLGAYANQDLPFEQLVEALQPRRDMSHTPLFQVMLILQNATGGGSQAQLEGGLRLSQIESHSGTSTFDLTLSLAESDGGLEAAMEYCTDLFGAAMVERMLAHYEILLRGGVANPDTALVDLPLLSADEQRQLLLEWNPAPHPWNLEQNLATLFATAARRNLDSIAVIDPAAPVGQRALSYAQLEIQANRLAHVLQRHGVGPDTPVALLLEKSIPLVVGILATFKAGGAYVPLDPAALAERLCAMLADCSPAVILATAAGDVASLLPPASRLPVLDPSDPALAEEPDTAPTCLATPDSLAYLIYTSGSTGTPKGVMIRQRSLVSAYYSWEEAYGLGDSVRRHLQMASPTFDVFTGDLTRALGSGGTLVLCPRDWLMEPVRLAALLRDEQIACAEFVPAVLRALAEHLEQTSERLDGMKLLVCGSDQWLGRDYARVRQLCGAQTRLINSYGLTEATVDSAFFEDAHAELAGEAVVPIGRPYPNSALYILDAQLRPVPIGVPGELCVGGVAVAEGYLHQPALTAEKFVSWDGAGLAPPGRLYRTGDRARYRVDGTIEYLGRVDNQLKLRGLRIEPGEIEAALAQHPAVRAAAVAARTAPNGDTRLVGYVVSASLPDSTPPLRLMEKELGGEVERAYRHADLLRAHLNARVPEYMIPALFVEVAALPLTSNGKVDRKALPEPVWEHVVEARKAPRTQVEGVLATLWAKVLGLSAIGIEDDFFLHGGHSLLATQLITRIREAFQIDLPLRTVFESPTVALMAEQVEIAIRSTRGMLAPPITRAPRDTTLPLSFAQQRLWFLDQLEPHSPFYNLPETVRLTGPLDVAALDHSLNQVVCRHEILRTIFAAVDGRPHQVILPELHIPLLISDLCGHPDAEAEALRLASEETARPFDLACGPLLRVRLVRLAADDHLVILVLHHIITDGWSSGVLIREIGAFYGAFVEGQSAPLPQLPIQYADYAVWQRAWLQASDGERESPLQTQLAYWKQQLRGAPPLLELPTDRPRPPIQSFAGAFQSFVLPIELSTKLRELCRQTGATMFMTVLAAFNVLLMRYSGQDDICVGTPVANRDRAELEPLVGFFVNTLVLRTDLSGDPGFRILLGRVRETALSAYAHQDLPFEMVVDALQPPRDMSHTPLFQVMFTLQTERSDTVVDAGTLRMRTIDAHSGTSKFDVSLFAVDAPEGLSGALEYNTDLFDQRTIERMLGHFQILLEAIVAAPDQPVAALPLLSADESHCILIDWNATAAPIPNCCLHDLIAAQAVRTPDAIALVAAERVPEQHDPRSAPLTQRTLSYRELDTQANQLAHHLRRLGVGPDQLVAVCMPRCPELPVALLGTLKAGGAYVPIDPSYPAERIRFMLEDARPPVLLTIAALGPQLTEILAESSPTTIMLLDSAWVDISAEPITPPESGVTPAHLAYVIYTSGSTGRPKGAMIHHRGLVNYLTWAVGAYPLEEGRGAPVHSSISFDLTVTSMFAPLLSGRTVFLLPEALGVETLTSALERESGFSLVKITPAHLDLLGRQLDPATAAACTHAFIIGGENLTSEHVAFWRRYAPQTALVNEYGPTETVVGCCVYTVTPETPQSGSIPIGRPIANTQLYILDRYRQPVPMGVVGELYIGGAGVARGYLNRPELTAERFVAISDARFLPPGTEDITQSRLYKTGDLARYRADGVIEYLGRADDQVKLRGFRIELGEIEAVLAEHPAVQDAAVVLREDTPGAKRLVAYLTTCETPQEEGVLSAVLRAYMAARLPEYMIPASFIELSAMPLSPNGKVERKALPAPSGERPEIDSIYTPPSTPAEQTLAQIWAEVLGVAQVGIHDNFFALGGDSIMTIQVIARAGTAGLRLTPRQLFEAPTVAGLAALAESSAADPAGPAVQTESSFANDDADFSDFNWSQEDLQDILGAIEQSLDPQ